MFTLGVFSWSLLQFTLVTTSMGKKGEEQEHTEKVQNITFKKGAA